jgi:uncharacterized membrane protein
MGNIESGKQKRFREIDALRGLAVLLMVFNHGLSWAYPGTAYNIVTLFGTLALGDIATPMFYLAAGISLYFSLQSRLRKDNDPLYIRSQYTTRLGKLFIIGIFMSLGWGVLQAQAITLLAIAWLILSFMPANPMETLRSYLPAIIFGALVVHFLLTSSSMPHFLHNVIAGQFPIFAILAINAIGFYLAPRLHLRTFSLRYIGLGIVLMVSALLYGEFISPMIRHGASFSFLMFGIGLSAMVLGIFHLNVIQTFSVFKYLALVGKDSLFLYIFHYVAFFVPFFFSGFMLQLSAPVAVIFSTVMTSLIILTAHLRRNSRVTVYYLFDTLTSTAWAYVSRPVVLRLHEYFTDTLYTKRIYPRNMY